MLFMENGGNFNILNDDGQSPIAFGSEELLKEINFICAKATCLYSENNMLESDNNKLAFHPIIPKEDEKDFALFHHSRLNQHNTISIDFKTKKKVNVKMI